MISTNRTVLKRKSTPTHKYEQLETVRRITVIKATGTRFINGITDQYDATFPKELSGLVNQELYEHHMEHLNMKIKQFWPCCLAYYCGYLCVPASLGLSLLIPRVCINEAEGVLLKQIAKLNQHVLGNSKLEMRLVKRCYDSWLVIEERDFAEFELHNDIVM